MLVHYQREGYTRNQSSDAAEAASISRGYRIMSYLADSQVAQHSSANYICGGIASSDTGTEGFRRLKADNGVWPSLSERRNGTFST